MSVGLSSVSVEVGGTNARSRVLIALNAMIPDTATTCRSKTISNARDNFMFGSGMPSKSIPADAADARRAVAASIFLGLNRRGILSRFIAGAFAPVCELVRRYRARAHIRTGARAIRNRESLIRWLRPLIREHLRQLASRSGSRCYVACAASSQRGAVAADFHKRVLRQITRNRRDWNKR